MRINEDTIRVGSKEYKVIFIRSIDDFLENKDKNEIVECIINEYIKWMYNDEIDFIEFAYQVSIDMETKSHFLEYVREYIFEADDHELIEDYLSYARFLTDYQEHEIYVIMVESDEAYKEVIMKYLDYDERDRYFEQVDKDDRGELKKGDYIITDSDHVSYYHNGRK